MRKKQSFFPGMYRKEKLHLRLLRSYRPYCSSLYEEIKKEKEKKKKSNSRSHERSPPPERARQSKDDAYDDDEDTLPSYSNAYAEEREFSNAFQVTVAERKGETERGRERRKSFREGERDRKPVFHAKKKAEREKPILSKKKREN